MSTSPLPIITRKGQIAAIVEPMLMDSASVELDALLVEFHDKVLIHKVKFPILEYAADLLYQRLPSTKYLVFWKKIMQMHTIGGNVIVGKMLQNDLNKHLDRCVNLASEYIILGDQWYVCDLIGERVLGHGLLCYPDQMFPHLQQAAQHKNSWIARSVGVGAHYAVKKGLADEHLPQLFELLLSLSNTTDYHTKKGIGWGAKTCIKFYPSLAQIYSERIACAGQWFRTKVKIGLQLAAKYAK